MFAQSVSGYHLEMSWEACIYFFKIGQDSQCSVKKKILIISFNVLFYYLILENFF